MSYMRQSSVCNIYPVFVTGSYEARPTPRLFPNIEGTSSQRRRPSLRAINQPLLKKLQEECIESKKPPARRRHYSELQQTVAFNLFRSRGYRRRANQHIQEYRKKSNSILVPKDVAQTNNPRSIQTNKRDYLHESSRLLKNEASLELRRGAEERQSSVSPDLLSENRGKDLHLEPMVVKSPLRKHHRGHSVQPSPKPNSLRKQKRASVQDPQPQHIRSLNFIRYLRPEHDDSSRPALAKGAALGRQLAFGCDDESCGPWKTLPDEI